MHDDLLEVASVQYDDMVGTCAFDHADATHLAKEVGLDRDRWWMLGFNAYASEGFGHLTLYLRDRREEMSGNFENLQVLAERNGGVIDVIAVSVPVESQFDEPDPDTDRVMDILLRSFKRLDVVALERAAVQEPGHRLRITRRIELEELDDA